MDRRGFLRTLGLVAATAAAAPKLLIPEPTTAVALPERRIFLPPSGGWPDLADDDFDETFGGTSWHGFREPALERSWGYVAGPTETRVTIEGYSDSPGSPDFIRAVNGREPVRLTLPGGQVVRACLDSYDMNLMGMDRLEFTVLPGEVILFDPKTVAGGSLKSDGCPRVQGFHTREWSIDRGRDIQRLF